MNVRRNRGTWWWLAAAMAAGLLMTAAGDARAAPPEQPLFDRFSLKLEGTWVELNTVVRLDSKALGRGTALEFEDDLDLDKSKTIPAAAFEWQVGRRHRLAVRWQDIDRDSSSQALEEIRWGDEIIPIEASVFLEFNITQYAIDWTYYPWVEERWAAGVGLGVRVLEVYAALVWEEDTIGRSGADDAEGTGPLPYVNLEYRRMLSDHWRLMAGVGWLSVEIDEVDGGQWLGRASVEYLAGRRWAFGGALNYSTIDVDWESTDFLGSLDLDINDISLFARVRF